MSHFSLAVLHRDPDWESIAPIIAPFDGTTKDPQYRSFHEDDDYKLNTETGKRGYFMNDNARYDWFVPGGRWRGILKLKPGATGRYFEPSKDLRNPDDPMRCDSAQIKDIDFSPSEEKYQNAMKVWDCLVEGKPWAGDIKNEPLQLYKPEYYKELYGDKEVYARQMSDFFTHAYIDESKKAWYETGMMGWFGFCDETKKSREAYLADFKRDIIGADPEMYLTIVDCHI